MAKDNAKFTIHNAQRKYIDAEMFAKRIEASPAFGNMAFEGELLRRVVLDLLDNAPNADVEEVKHGKWIEKFKDGFCYYDCPFCDDGYVVMERDENKPNYCHNCGAKMDGGKAE